MPHFAVDERAHGHRKLVRAGNAAVGLWVRLGSYSCDQLSDGLIPGAIAAAYGTGPQLAKLVTVGLLHPAGHACDRCADPEPGDYVLHDYIGPNPSRVTVEKRKAAAAAKKRGQRAADSTSIRDGIEDDSKRNRPRFDNETDSNRPPVSDDFAGDEGLSPRDESHPRARPRPSPLPSPSTSYGGTSSSPPSSELGRLPVAAGAGEVEEVEHSEIGQLIAAMRTQGMSVAWQLKPEEWPQLREQIQRVGIGALVEHAVRVWQASKTPPYSARYFLPGWLTLQPAPEGPHGGLRAVGGPSKTNDYLADMAAIADELRQKGQSGS